MLWGGSHSNFEKQVLAFQREMWNLEDIAKELRSGFIALRVFLSNAESHEKKRKTGLPSFLTTEIHANFFLKQFKAGVDSQSSKEL